MKFNKTGQAALEFLTTYGWAFLVILVMIGGLSYFGVFNFTDKLPDVCKLDGRIACGSVYVITDSDVNTVQLQILNNDMSKIDVKEVQVIEKTLLDDTSSSWCVGNVTTSTIISPEKYADVQVNMNSTNRSVCGITDFAGTKKTFLVKVIYSPASSSIEMIANGQITTTVNAG